MPPAPRTHLAIFILLAACGGSAAGGGGKGSPGGTGSTGGAGSAGNAGNAGDEDAFGPLEVGADYASYRRVTDEMFRSLVHGNRWVHVYVNEIGADAYLDSADIPIGTIVVKTSVQNVDGRPSDIEGPIFVMEKRAKGYAPEHGDWWYAIHWANPPAAEAAKFGGPIYWRGRSQRAAYCWKCHDDYANSLGGLVPSSLLPR
ncbi:MAG TPA: cytochrome P460 family protein [Kofleriaceae bacterium]|nr:cytochrome P460 family protein [Kofleriaceae bacterium]